ncbi:MAG: alpha/beta hydrolase, partial [Anaerolineae bacterium]
MLLLDFRAHGRSPGRRATFGYLERWDVQAAVEFLQGRGMRRIGLLGFSYGGIASMLAAPICPDVGAVVTDGGPARLRSAIIGRGAELGLPKWLVAFLAWLTVAVTSACLGVNLSRYEPVRWVGKIAPRPILFIHGDLDPYLLLSLPRLRGIQWVPGYGKPGPEHWLPVLRRIRESGKLCQVTVSPE